MRGTYTRWTRGQSNELTADILSDFGISADPERGQVTACISSRAMSPDEARMIGVRLIEAAALADGDRAVRIIP